MFQESDSLAAIRLAIAFALILLASAVLNDAIFPSFDATFPMGREVWTYCGASAGFAIAAVAYFRPALLVERRWSVGALVLLAASLAIIAAGVGAHSVLLICAGSVCAGVAETWLTLLFGIAVVSLSSQLRMAVLVSAACAYALAASGMYFIELSCAQGAVGYWACFFIAYLLFWGYARELVAYVRNGSALAEVDATNPSSFLPLSHSVYVAILLFNMACGCALTFCSMDSVPASAPLMCVPILLLFCVVVGMRRSIDADKLFSFALLLALGGFLLVPMAIGGDLGDPLHLSNALMQAGSVCFLVLVVLLMAAMTSRNKLAAVWLFSLAQGFRCLGIGLGTALGHGVNALATISYSTALLVSAVVTFVFVAYNFVALRNFSFEATIAGIQPVGEVRERDESELVEESAGPGEESFEERCARVADEYGLTRRERDVFTLLAQGRTSPVIEERLVVSRNTVKTHVRNIYGKLGVHSQQELIDIVERAGEG